MDRTDSGKLNIPSPHGSFQRTQSFIKQILSMKADLNQLFPSEEKEKTKYSPSPSASSASSDFQCSSSRSYGMYKKKNNRSVKLAPLTPDSVSFSTPSTDVTPASSKRLSVGFSAQESPSDHSRLWQDVHSPSNARTTLPSVHVPPPRALNPTIARSLHFAEDDELINLHSDDSSVGAVQCEEDYYNIHHTRSQDPLPRKISKPRKSVTLDALERSFMAEPAITLAPLRSSLPNMLQSSSSETIVDEYDARSLTLQPYSSASTSFSQSVDGDDEMDQRIYAPLQVRTKSYNGAGLAFEMSDVATEEEAMVSTAVKVKQSPRVAKQMAPRNAVAVMPSKEIEVEPVDDYGDDDFVDLDNDVASPGAAESEVELFLEAYCSGKETQATTALEALTLESSSKKSVKQRKGTGIPAKKLLSMGSFDDDGEIEEFDDSDSVTEKTYRSVSQGSSGRREGCAHGHKYATEEDYEDEEENNNCALYSRSMDATMDPYHDDVDIIYVL
eukprot:gene11673-8314_t